MAVVTLQVNDTTVAVPAGVPLLQALAAAGVALPTLCHHPRLSPVAACRLCLVELEGASRPLPACVTAAAEGQRLRTDTPALQAGRRLIVELLAQAVEAGDPAHIVGAIVVPNARGRRDLGGAQERAHLGDFAAHRRHAALKGRADQRHQRTISISSARSWLVAVTTREEAW